MKLQHVVAQVYFRPWLITPEAHEAIVRLVSEHLGDAIFAARPDGVGPCGEMVEADQMEVDESTGIAHIPVGGVIAQKLTGFERGVGAVDVVDIENDLDEAESNPLVKSILLDIDSPGGMVNGTPELAARIQQVDKPIYAFTNGQAASAAYWLAASTDAIFATKTATVGSIGAYIPWIDRSVATEARGLKVDIIRSDAYKGMGFPGTSLTEEQRSVLQHEVDSIASMFKEDVRMMRRDVAEETMRGQAFLAGEGVERGLVDEIVPNKKAVIALIS